MLKSGLVLGWFTYLPSGLDAGGVWGRTRRRNDILSSWAAISPMLKLQIEAVAAAAVLRASRLALLTEGGWVSGRPQDAYRYRPQTLHMVRSWAPRTLGTQSTRRLPPLFPPTMQSWHGRKRQSTQNPNSSAATQPPRYIQVPPTTTTPP